jgi:hypothetical protein
MARVRDSFVDDARALNLSQRFCLPTTTYRGVAGWV